MNYEPRLLYPPLPQVAATVGYVAAPGPFLCTPLLADTAADTVDARTVKYLLHAALKEKKEEEKEERRKAKEARRLEVTALLAVPMALGTQAQQRRIMELSDEVDAETHPKRRKRKKRRKRRTPRTSSLPGRARRRQQQWYACNAGFTGYDAPRVMFPSGVARPKMLRILAGMDQKDRCSGIFKAGFPVYNTPRAVLCGMARLVLLVTVHLALCFLPCLQARDARHHGRYGPEGFVRHVQGLVCWVLTMSLALCSSCLSQAQDVRHHGRHGPQDSVEVHRCSSWTRSFTCPLVCCEWRHGPDSAENCLAIPQVQLLDKVLVPVVCNDNALVLMLRTLEVPQLQFLDKVFLRCSSWTRFSCPLCATTGPRVPDSSETRGGPTGADLFPYSTLLGLTVDTLASV